MEHDDKEINCHKDKEIIDCQEPILEYEVAGSVAPPDVHSNGRILVKLRLPKMPEEVEDAAAAAIYPAEEIKSHYCKECNKSFSSGKALGGHMSSAHVQANKDYSYKKLSSRMKRHHKDSGTAAMDNTCSLCGKVFRSKKSLFGHMRCHPERDWRGMEPPAKTKIDSPESSLEPESEKNQDGDEEDQIDSGSPTADVGCNLKGWPRAIKRGRGPVNPIIRASGSSSEEKETFVAGRQLIRLLEGESGKRKVGPELNNPLARQGPEFDFFKKQKLDSGGPKLRILERDAIDDAVEVRRKMENKGKGKEKKALLLEPQDSDTGSTISLPDAIDYNDELYITAIEVLMNGKRENQRRSMEEKMMQIESKTEITPTQQKGDSVKSSTEKYICNICNRSFPTHQALGGHRSSHNKFKVSIVNTADRRANTFKEKKKSKKEANAKIVASNVADDDIIQTAEKVGLGFDLNMMPDEEEDKDGDGDGDTSNHTSNSCL